MFWIALGVIVFLIIVFNLFINARKGKGPYYPQGFDNESFWFGSVFSLIGTTFVVFLLIMGCSFLYKKIPATYSGRTNIVAANDSTSVQGHFGLFSGYINEQWRYYYYYAVRPDTYTMGWVAADSSVIQEDAPPGIGWIDYFQSKPSSLELFGVPQDSPEHFVIHVPKGSVVQKYQFDLQK